MNPLSAAHLLQFARLMTAAGLACSFAYIAVMPEEKTLQGKGLRILGGFILTCLAIWGAATTGAVAGPEFSASAVNPVFIMGIALYCLLGVIGIYLRYFAAETGRQKARMREELLGNVPSSFDWYSPLDLEMFNGRNGTKVLLAYRGNVYDLSDHATWRLGLHFNQHAAGRDLTGSMKLAPHKPEVLTRLPPVGVYAPAAKGSGSPLIMAMRKKEKYCRVLKKTGAAVAMALFVATLF